MNFSSLIALKFIQQKHVEYTAAAPHFRDTIDCNLSRNIHSHCTSSNEMEKWLDQFDSKILAKKLLWAAYANELPWNWTRCAVWKFPPKLWNKSMGTTSFQLNRSIGFTIYEWKFEISSHNLFVSGSLHIKFIISHIYMGQAASYTLSQMIVETYHFIGSFDCPQMIFLPTANAFSLITGNVYKI